VLGAFSLEMNDTAAAAAL